MNTLESYISQCPEINGDINEGLFKNAISLIEIKQINPQDLLTGIMNMYDYICDKDDMEMFYQDFPVGQRLFWKNMYQLYEKKVWSIIDFDENDYQGHSSRSADPEDDDIESGTGIDQNLETSSELISDLGLENNVITRVTPEFRRELRKIINNSRNKSLDLKPSDPQSILPIYDDQFKKGYFITLNRTTGILNRLFRRADLKFLELAFKRMGAYLDDGKISMEE